MKEYVIQRGIERPLLIMGGRRFNIRAYVVACMRPAPRVEDRVLEVYLAEYELARHQLHFHSYRHHVYCISWQAMSRGK